MLLLNRVESHLNKLGVIEGLLEGMAEGVWVVWSTATHLWTPSKSTMGMSEC